MGAREALAAVRTFRKEEIVKINEGIATAVKAVVMLKVISHEGVVPVLLVGMTMRTTTTMVVTRAPEVNLHRRDVVGTETRNQHDRMNDLGC